MSHQHFLLFFQEVTNSKIPLRMPKVRVGVENDFFFFFFLPLRHLWYKWILIFDFMGTFIYNIASIIATLSFCHVRGFSYHNILIFVQHPVVLFQINITKCTQPPTVFHPKPQTVLAFHVSTCQWQGLTRTLPYSKGSVCESLIQSCLKQLPQPGSVPLRSSYIFCPNALCVSWVW